MSSKASQLEKRVDKLTAQLAAMAGPGKKGGKPKNRKKSKKGVSSVTETGRCTLRKCAPILTVTLDANKQEEVHVKNLFPTDIPGLAKVAAVFERYRFESLAVYYKPLVGTTIGGAITIGIDWDLDTPPSTRVGVAAYTPSQTLPVWEDGERKKMVLPKSRLMSRPWFFLKSQTAVAVDKVPAVLTVGVSAESKAASWSLGEVWVDATVTFDGISA